MKKILIISASICSLCAAVWGVYSALHSPLFVVQVVEVADLADRSPVDAQTISDLAFVPVGKISLFDLDLNQIEKRILTNSWIREVRLQKKFPETLSISVIFKQPRAL